MTMFDPEGVDPLSVPLPALLMDIADPESTFSPEARNLAIETVLGAMHNDASLMLFWENMRQASGSDDERTVQDFDEAEVIRIAETFYGWIKTTGMPDPRHFTQAGRVAAVVPEGVPDEDVAEFNKVAIEIGNRLARAEFVDQPHPDIPPTPRTDFYVLGYGITANAAEMLGDLDEEDQQIMIAAQEVWMKLFLWARSRQRELRNRLN